MMDGGDYSGDTETKAQAEGQAQRLLGWLRAGARYEARNQGFLQKEVT
jgi:hypothetical protein